MQFRVHQQQTRTMGTMGTGRTGRTGRTGPTVRTGPTLRTIQTIQTNRVMDTRALMYPRCGMPSVAVAGPRHIGCRQAGSPPPSIVGLSSVTALQGVKCATRDAYRRHSVLAASVAGSRTQNVVAAADSSGTIWTVPTILTLLRVVAIPLLVAAWFSSQWMWCFTLFVGASVTDFFDGYLARKWNCSTPFGAFLDPVADKLMVATILILIGTVPVPAGFFAGNAWLLPAIACIIIAREITMSALREWAAALGPEAHAAAAVNTLGKYKTSSQMASLVLLLGAKTGWLIQAGYEAMCTDIGMGLLFVATFLTVQSVLGYFAGLWKFFV